MAGKLLFLSALVVVCVSTALATLATPQCGPPRVNDCNNKAVQGAVFWESMQYEYIPKRLTRDEAEAYCKPWDERVCTASSRFRAHLISILSEKELTHAAQKAYESACIREGNFYWIGVTSIYYGRLRYSDGLSSRFAAFGDNKISSLSKGRCLAMNGLTGKMVEMSCAEKIGFVCKIAPTQH
ncbi:uncharacterized protein [Diadema setosum]|uniref:uncharacterized protein n=1 Tax=Diadema setosum TaxID=31175 RepID=UPI003B3B7684